jgi:UDP-N-acetylglucosamine 2-epimerase (hydrolysing)
MLKKKILFLTGTRADFGKLKSLMLEVEHSPDFDCNIFITGMHMLSRYGSTCDEVKKCGFKNTFVYINQIADNKAAMDMVLSSTIEGLGHYVREFPPDLIVVHGDRVEALAGAIAGSLNNILVAHIEGGELSGTIDELIRHSITKLVHLHFVSNATAAKRLIQMGESKDSVFVIGSPDIDIMLSSELPSIQEVKKWYEINFKEFGIFLYHPVTTELNKIKRNVKNVIDAIKESGMNFVVVYPNNDSGSEVIFDELTRLEGNPKFRMFPSIRFEYFLTLLKHSKVIVGNSSTGIRTAPVYGVPTINIGSRQLNRFNHPSIINVNEDREEILKALNNLPAKPRHSLHFGKGKSTQIFMELIRQPKLWQTPRQKVFMDISDKKAK